MPLTDNCDLYAAVHEDGINRVLWHVMRQRPSLFNYASPPIAGNPSFWCHPVDVSPDVLTHGNPLFNESYLLPVLGADAPPVEVSFIVQLVKAEIDFQPSNVVQLPAELTPPLKPQRLALHGRLCGGIACPSEGQLEQIPLGGPLGSRVAEPPPRPPIVLRPRRPKCFCLDFYAVCHVESQYASGIRFLVAAVDNVDIVDIKPDGLEDSLICYLQTTLTVLLREKLAVPFQALFLRLPILNFGSLPIGPTPNPPIPFNPAVEEDQFKAFMSLGVTP